jgi:hypothetical protein
VLLDTRQVQVPYRAADIEVPGSRRREPRKSRP